MALDPRPRPRPDAASEALYAARLRAAELGGALRRERSARVALCWVALLQLLVIVALGAAVAWDMARTGVCL